MLAERRSLPRFQCHRRWLLAPVMLESREAPPLCKGLGGLDKLECVGLALEEPASTTLQSEVVQCLSLLPRTHNRVVVVEVCCCCICSSCSCRCHFRCHCGGCCCSSSRSHHCKRGLLHPRPKLNRDTQPCNSCTVVYEASRYMCADALKQVFLDGIHKGGWDGCGPRGCCVLCLFKVLQAQDVNSASAKERYGIDNYKVQNTPLVDV